MTKRSKERSSSPRDDEKAKEELNPEDYPEPLPQSDFLASIEVIETEMRRCESDLLRNQLHIAELTEKLDYNSEFFDSNAKAEIEQIKVEDNETKYLMIILKTCNEMQRSARMVFFDNLSLRREIKQLKIEKNTMAAMILHDEDDINEEAVRVGKDSLKDHLRKKILKVIAYLSNDANKTMMLMRYGLDSSGAVNTLDDIISEFGTSFNHINDLENCVAARIGMRPCEIRDQLFLDMQIRNQVSYYVKCLCFALFNALLLIGLNSIIAL